MGGLGVDTAPGAGWWRALGDQAPDQARTTCRAGGRGMLGADTGAGSCWRNILPERDWAPAIVGVTIALGTFIANKARCPSSASASRRRSVLSWGRWDISDRARAPAALGSPWVAGCVPSNVSSQVEVKLDVHHVGGDCTRAAFEPRDGDHRY